LASAIKNVAMSYIKIWIHAVWSTKNRAKLLTNDIRPIVFEHIQQNGIEKGIYLEAVNGYSDHVHCLFKLKNDQTIMKNIQLLKGESSHWINRQNFLSQKFEWQKEYFAVSVSESMVNKVKMYINNQEEHHMAYSWQEEYDQFINRYNFNIING
jgi:putative transposase